MLDQLKMLKQAHELQKKMKDIQVSDEFMGVKVTINGKQDVLSIEISEEILEDKSKLENAVKQAMNNALAKSQKEVASQMKGDFGSMFGA